MTRARDYLILAPRMNTGATLSASWLDLLPGTPRPLVLPSIGNELSAAGNPVAVTAEDLTAAETEAPEPPEVFRGVFPDGEAPAFPPRRVTPSAASGGPVPKWRAVSIGDRLPLQGTCDMAALGEALHGFFAADRPKATPAWRKAAAERLLAAWGVSALWAEDAVLAADRLWNHLEAEHPAGIWRREWPVTRISGGQVLAGRIDLVVEQARSLAVYDHKSFPGGHERWPDEVALHVPQIKTYADALRDASGLPVCRMAIHLPISGMMLVLES
jgi:hypothetical protein